MITRPKSIFTLGEEGDEEEHGNDTVAVAATVKVSKSPKPGSAYLVGLRILIQCSEQEPNVVAKLTAVRSSPTASPPHPSPAGSGESSFLKACYLCKRELDAQKDVYMYRGDQGFCSVECRGQQIELDEKRELEATVRRRRRTAAAAARVHGHGVRESDRWRRISAAA